MGNEQSANQGRPPTNLKIEEGEAAEEETPQKKSGIVVVGTKQDPGLSGTYLDTYITRLNTCPSFEPIFSSATSTEARPQPGNFVSNLDWKAATKASSRLQDHLHSCAEAVSFDQNSLTAQIKQVDHLATQILLKYTERQKSFAKHAEHARKVEDISASLKRVRMNLDVTFSMLDDLNKLLPEEERVDMQ